MSADTPPLLMIRAAALFFALRYCRQRRHEILRQITLAFDADAVMPLMLPICCTRYDATLELL